MTHNTEIDACHLCGDPLSRPRWKRLIGMGAACRDKGACRDRFVSLLRRGRLTPTGVGKFTRVTPPGEGRDE